VYKQFTLAIGLMLSMGQIHAAVVWDWDATSNTLYGAQNVDVDGTLYDVAFLDGSCIDLFGGCDEASDFDFATRSEAITASRALLDQVFLNVPAAPADFDTIPYLTNGCESSWVEPGGPGGGSIIDCKVLTPTLDAFSIIGSSAHAVNNNSNNVNSDGWGGIVIQEDEDFTAADTERAARITFADWTITAVPVPAAVWLFGTALFAFIGIGKLRTQA
jgi:hypothetical protein